MTLRESAVVTARWWGILPHVIWRYPFRYFKELRAAYLATLHIPKAEDEGDEDSVDWRTGEARERVIEFDRELFRGDAL